jgi:hypothetical protein
VDQAPITHVGLPEIQTGQAGKPDLRQAESPTFVRLESSIYVGVSGKMDGSDVLVVSPGASGSGRAQGATRGARPG